MKNKLFKKDNWSFKTYALIGSLIAVAFCGGTAEAWDLDDAHNVREAVKLSHEEGKETHGLKKETNPNKENVESNTKPRNIWHKNKAFMEKQELEFREMLLKKESETRKIEQVPLYELTSKTTALIK